MRELDLPKVGRGRVEGRDENARSYISLTYKSKRVNPNDKDWEKMLEEIMEKKIKKSIKKKSLLNLNDVVIEFPFTKEILEHLNLGKLNPPSIDPYDGIKDPIDYVQTF